MLQEHPLELNQMKSLIIISTILFALFTTSSYGQVAVEKKRNYIPAWTFQQDSINIHGISVGLFPADEESKGTNTNGIRLELIGPGIVLPLIPGSQVAQTENEFAELNKIPFSEKVNGLNLSSGTYCHCKVNGFTVSAIAQNYVQVNGVATSLFLNISQKHNGVMMALVNDVYRMNGLQLGLGNKSIEMKGVQVGLVNRSVKLKGIQLGLWNINAKRKLPIINWN